jgi:hypothetical protein
MIDVRVLRPQWQGEDTCTHCWLFTDKWLREGELLQRQRTKDNPQRFLQHEILRYHRNIH